MKETGRGIPNPPPRFGGTLKRGWLPVGEEKCLFLAGLTGFTGSNETVRSAPYGCPVARTATGCVSVARLDPRSSDQAHDLKAEILEKHCTRCVHPVQTAPPISIPSMLSDWLLVAMRRVSDGCQEFVLTGFTGFTGLNDGIRSAGRD